MFVCVSEVNLIVSFGLYVVFFCDFKQLLEMFIELDYNYWLSLDFRCLENLNFDIFVVDIFYLIIGDVNQRVKVVVVVVKVC